MQKTLKLLVISLAVVLAVTPALASGNANFVIGQRSIDTGQDDLDDVEDQPAFGVNVDFNTGDLPFSWVIGLHASTKDDTVNLGGGASGDVTASLTELSFGLGWMWGKEKMHPYVGGGLTYVQASVELDISGPGSSFSFDEDDQSPALYVDGGIYWRLGSAFNLGVGARIVEGTDFEVNGDSFDADYMQGHVVLGWGWD